jgi:ribosomal protein L7Ae-like RNA K-turn-binding protein
VLETAVARAAFAKAARASVLVPPDLSSGLKAALRQRIGDFLGLARRAGQAVAGFTKAREWLEAGRAALVLQASDGSADERARFLSGQRSADTQVPVIAPLEAARLGAVFGRDHAVHVAVAPGRLAELLRSESERLAGLEASLPASGQVAGKAGRKGRRHEASPSGAAGRSGL